MDMFTAKRTLRTINRPAARESNANTLVIYRSYKALRKKQSKPPQPLLVIMETQPGA